MRTVVISQPMFFPWVGLFEQIRLADVYVHYDDVQFSKGGFFNRVQIKTPDGFKWLTLPLRDFKLGQAINEVAIDQRQDWRRKHLAFLTQTYAKAPYQEEMLDLVQQVYQGKGDTVADVAMASIEVVCDYYGLKTGRTFARSSDLGIPGQSSQRVLDVVRHYQGTRYVTGHGARQYLDHGLFEAHGVRVEYMNYQKLPYPQLHGDFNPYVSILDLIANMGKAGQAMIASGTTYWKEFIQ